MLVERELDSAATAATAAALFDQAELGDGTVDVRTRSTLQHSRL